MRNITMEGQFKRSMFNKGKTFDEDEFLFKKGRYKEWKGKEIKNERKKKRKK